MMGLDVVLCPHAVGEALVPRPHAAETVVSVHYRHVAANEALVRRLQVAVIEGSANFR